MPEYGAALGYKSGIDFPSRYPITGDRRRDADIHAGIQQSLGRSFGSSPLVPTYGQATGYVNAFNRQLANAYQNYGNSRMGGTAPFSLASGAPFAPLGGPGGPGGAGGSGAPPTNPFTTIQNTKNPSIQSAIDSILNGIRGLNGDPNQNPNILRSNTKSQELASQISGATNRFQADVNDSRQSFSDFVNAFRNSQPQAEANLRSDTGALDEVYDQGPAGLKAQLDKIARDRAISSTQAAQRAMQMAAARNNFNRLVGGNSSYADRQINDQVGGIASINQKERADLDRSNLLGVTDARTRLTGQRNNLLDSYLNRFLTPAFARQQLGGGELAQLGALTNLDQANTFYNLDSPEQMIARRLGLLGGVANLDQSNNFYGVQRPYEQDVGGYRPVGVSNRNRGGPSDFLPDFSNYDLGGPEGYQPSAGPGPRATNFSTGAWPGMSNADRAAAEYQRISGANPNTDPTFSNELWNSITGGRGGYYPGGSYTPGGGSNQDMEDFLYYGS